MSGNHNSCKKESNNKTKYLGLVEAAEVLFGEWVSIDDCPLVEDKTPETFLLQKYAVQDLSEECRIMVDVILSLPEEMFLLNGRIKTVQLSQKTKERTGWSLAKIKMVKTRLEKSLSMAI